MLFSVRYSTLFVTKVNGLNRDAICADSQWSLKEGKVTATPYYSIHGGAGPWFCRVVVTGVAKYCINYKLPRE